jgi:hypothetical protein
MQIAGETRYDTTLIPWDTLVQIVPAAESWHPQLCARLIGMTVWGVESAEIDAEVCDLPANWIPCGEVTEDQSAAIMDSDEWDWINA